MELRHLRYFVRAAELLHFTHAAESLYVSQPALSSHIHQLEEEVGLPLFDRIGRSVRLTEAGTIFLEHAKRTLQELDCAQSEIKELKQLSRGTVRIGAILTFGPDVLPSVITSFVKLYPRIRITVKTGPSDLVEHELLSGNIDLALSFVPPATPEIKSESVFDEPIFVVVNDRHPLLEKSEVDLADISAFPLALVSRRWTARRVYDAFFAEKQISPNVLMEIDDLQALRQIISTSNTAALMSRMAASDHPRLRLIPIAGAPLSIHYGILWHGQAQLSPSAQAFLEHFIEKCRSHTKSPGSAV